jgi:hypothetical protein
MSQHDSNRWSYGDVIALRYVSTDSRIEMCWPVRVVSDSADQLCVFIAAGSRYKAGPKLRAAEKLREQRDFLPPDDYEWRHDTLRLMRPGECHSVWLFWEGSGSGRRFTKYFVNLEEPFRRTAVGVDTQDHTLDIVVQPDLTWSWRDDAELDSHVRHGFYSASLAAAARAEGRRAVRAISDGTHPCLDGWTDWRPDPAWRRPELPAGWDTVPLTYWERRAWAYDSD